MAVPEALLVPRLAVDDPDDPDELGAARDFAADALRRGHEGVVVKSASAGYAMGRRGAGWVKVKINGKREVVNVTIADEALKDKELVEDLVKAAVNQAIQRVNQQVAEEYGKMASGIGLPFVPGMPIPGLS